MFFPYKVASISKPKVNTPGFIFVMPNKRTSELLGAMNNQKPTTVVPRTFPGCQPHQPSKIQDVTASILSHAHSN
jgi:hypothetical protein